MFNRLRLGFKIMGGFALVTFVTLIVGVIGFIGVDSMNNSLKDISQSTLPSVRSILEIKQYKTAILASERSLLLAKTKEEVDFQKGRLEGYWAAAEEDWKVYDSLPKTAEEEQYWQQLGATWNKWKESHKKVIALVDEHTTESMQKALALSYGDVRDNYLAAEDLMTKLVDINKEEADKATKKADASGLLLKSISVGSVILGIIFAIIIGMLLSNAITKPVERIIAGLTEGSQQVAAASVQLADGSQQLAEGNSELAASIEETSSTLEESSSMIQQNSGNTRQAAVLAAQTRQSAEKGTQEMQDMMSAMDELKRSSDQIAKIIKVIDDIAFQTNILALNAAVEAARAGDAGMGFAVVAEEVRNLAQRSAQAARETAGMIESNITYSQNGLATARRVGESLTEITVQAKKVNELVDEIAAAGQEQAQGIVQINKAIAQMEKAVQQSAATAEESSASAQQLNAQAETMQEAVYQLVQVVKGAGQAREDIYQRVSHHPVRKSGIKQIPVTSGKRMLQDQNKRAGSRVIDPETVIPLDDDSDGF